MPAGKLRSRPQNTDLYFRPGFSWTRRAPRLVPYVVPAGCIPSVSRYQAFPSGDPFLVIAIAASNGSVLLPAVLRREVSLAELPC